MCVCVCVYHQVIQIAWIPLTLSCNPSLSAITLCRYTTWHPVSAQKSLQVNIAVSMSQSSQKNITYELILILQQSLLCLVHLGWFVVRWEVRGCIAAILLGTVSRIYSEQCSSCQTFSPSFLLKSKRWIHVVVLTWLQLERISILFRHRDQIFI